MHNATASQNQLESQILSYLRFKFPEYYHKSITTPKKESIQYISSMFDEFSNIHEEREKNNLHRAFKHAWESFKFTELKKSSATQACSSFIAYDEVAQIVVQQAKRRVNRFSRIFSLLNKGVSLLDIVISVFLILVVTQISHTAGYYFDTFLLSTLFIAVVALTKVSIDRFFIIPMIDNSGWRFYERMMSYTRQELIKLNATFLVLMESVVRNENIARQAEIINRQRREIFSQRRIIPRSTSQ